MVRKRASKTTDDVHVPCRPKRSRINNEECETTKHPTSKSNKGNDSSISECKSKRKYQSKQNSSKEIKNNTVSVKDNGVTNKKNEKSNQKQTKARQNEEKNSKKRKASTSNIKSKTKKRKEDIDNSCFSDLTSSNKSPKKHKNCKTSPIKDTNLKKTIEPSQEDANLLNNSTDDIDAGASNLPHFDSGEESEDIDWEDVQEAEGDHGNSETLSTACSTTTTKSEDRSVEISIEIPGLKGRKRKKKQEDLMTKIQKAMNKFQKQIQLEKHKVHLLMLISVGFHRNAVCNELSLQAFCLSFIPCQFANKSISKWRSDDLTDFLIWFKEEFPSLQKLNFTLLKNDVLLTDNLPRHLAEVLVAILRSLGFLTRLVCSLQPVPMKAESKASKKPKKEIKPNKQKVQDASQATPLSKQTLKNQNKTSPYFSSDATRKANKTPKTDTCKGKKTPNTTNNTSLKDKLSHKQTSKQGKPRKLRKKKKVNYNASGTSDGSDAEESDYEEETQQSSSDEDEHFEKPKKFKTPKSNKQKSVKSTPSPSVVEMIDDDDDFEVSSKPVIRRKSSQSSPDKPVQILSDDSDSSEDASLYSKGTTIDFWVEVYLPSKKSWSCIDMLSFSIDKPELCEEHSRQPLAYVIGFDNENKVKDVTERYATDWLSKTQKMRIDAEWWEETLLPYKTKKKKMDENEDSLLLEKHQEKPLPLSITEYKNHPLYVLKRHLLKFEGIYPETAATLGFIRGEAIYSRDCVHLLHTREKWMSLEARVVKQGEQPYKIVKGRVKRNQPNVDPNSVTIDLFGRWQTEDYKPPPAKDGKVPRNEYGNVELFKPSMLPPGTKHIQIPGIQKIAKKLGIDGAPAVVGFDFHCGFCHPIIDGLVVCKEHVSTLMDAWRQEQQEAKRRKEEKREKRVLGNWKLLVKSMVIRERLKRKYTPNNKESRTSSEQGEILEDEKVAEAVAWPQNMKEGKTSVADDGHCHVFLKKLHKKDKITGEWTKACACGFTLPLKQ